jgi:hypothetical protein
MRWFAALAVSLAGLSAAHANGRPPVTNGVFFQPSNNDALVVRTTFGLLVSRDAGCSFRWVCEQAIGYGGTYDPQYAIGADGTLFATTFTGLRVSRDGGCSWTTATEALPAGSPGRIADIWVDTVDIGPTGEVWVATAESGKPNDVYRSTDGGATFVSRGRSSPAIWWKSVAVARSDAKRVYLAGYQLTDPAPQAHLFTTIDGGASWTESALAGVQLGVEPQLTIAAIDPVNAQRVFVVSIKANGEGDRLYRSLDGGATLTPVLATTQAIAGVVIRDATTVLVAGLDGTYRSTDGGATFGAATATPHFGCIGQRGDGMLVGCAANWDPDFMAVGTSADALQWQKIFRFVELGGPLACPAGTPGRDLCDDQMWPGIQSQFGVTGPQCPSAVDLPGGSVDGAPPKDPGGCCDTGGSPLGAAALALVVAWLLLRRGC